jgi:hypothetical protein
MADVARAEEKTVDEVFEEAATRLLRRRTLRGFVVENQQLAAERRIGESDVPR